MADALASASRLYCQHHLISYALDTLMGFSGSFLTQSQPQMAVDILVSYGPSLKPNKPS
jgi:hypothetical protein